MAYLALYRMFRPDTFEGVVRQEHIIRVLKNQIAADRVGHAYLFCGPRGTGKTTVSRIFARAINCEHPVNGSPCGKCAACRALNEAGNLDISEIDAASNNGVDEMRELREKVQYPPVSCRYKVYIIDEVHMLTDSAFNALLKTLEEPPKHAVFIMATTEPHKIPATILSRCMRFDFKLLPQEDLENHLKAVLQKIGKKYEEEAVSAIARAGAGSDRDMLSIADMCVSYSADTLTYGDVTAVLGGADFFETGALCADILSENLSASLSRLEKMIAEGRGIGVLVKDVMSFLNNCAIAKMCKGAEDILSLPSQMYDYIKQVADNTDGHRLLRVTEIMAKAESDLKYSTSPRIIVETALIKAGLPQTDYNIDALIARVEKLEKGLESGKFALAPASPPPVPVPPVREKKAPERAEEREEREEDSFPVYPEEEPPFPAEEEEPVFEEYAPPSEPRVAAPEPRPRASAPAPKRAIEPEPTPVKRTEERREEPPKQERRAADKANTFGKFLRALRKNSKNGVLYVMCQDLKSEYRGDTFVLKTSSEVVYKSLMREGHAAAIREALESVNVSDYAVEFDGGGQKKVSLTEKVKEDFGDVEIEEI